MAGVSTKDIKLRIRSMESTRQITRAMEMVAASKLRRAQSRIAACQPYFETLSAALLDIARTNRDFSSPFVRPASGKRTCYVVIAGDRGLAGGYNHNLFSLAEETMSSGESVVIPIGKRSLEYFKTHGAAIFTDLYSEAAALTMSGCFELSRLICQGFRAGEFDAVKLLYTRFDSILSQTPCLRPALPIAPDAATERPLTSLTQYEPSAEEVFDAIVPECLAGLLYGALANSVASELSARRTAMDVATKNATEMIDRLNLDYNRARQAAITQEITEIVAGADA